MAKIMLYLGLGIVIDLCVSLYTRFVSLRLPAQASVSGALITFVTYLIFRYLITHWDNRLLIAYAVGTGLGTFIGVSIL